MKMNSETVGKLLSRPAVLFTWVVARKIRRCNVCDSLSIYAYDLWGRSAMSILRGECEEDYLAPSLLL